MILCVCHRLRQAKLLTVTLFSYSSVKPSVIGAKKNLFTEMLFFLSIQNICI